MPGIERLPMWLRLVIYWLVFSVVLTVIVSLIDGGVFDSSRLPWVLLVVGVGVIAEQVMARRGL